MLLGLYFIIALAFFVYPDDAAGNPSGDIPSLVVRGVKGLVGY